MTSFLFVASVYAAVCVYLGFWLGTQVERKAQEQARCQHTWDYRSLDGLDHFWQRVCLICGHYEKLEREQVPYHERCKAKNFRG